MSAGQEVGQIFGDGSGPAQALLRSPTVIIAGIGLWGMNIYLFRVFGIDYKRAFGIGGGGSGDDKGRAENGAVLRKKYSEDEIDVLKDPLDEDRMEEANGATNIDTAVESLSTTATTTHHRAITSSTEGEHLHHASQTTNGNGTMCNHAPAADTPPKKEASITSDKLLMLSFVLLILLHTTSYVYIHILEGDTIGAIFAFYFVCIIFVLIPLPSTKWLRRSLRIVLDRTVELLRPRCYCCRPGARILPVPFIDVFYADAMCSMSKVFFDWGMLWHLASHYPDPVPASTHSIIIPSVCAALPYLIRARQCLVMNTVGKLKNDPKRYQHILNAIKYSTSLFPICLSAYQKTVGPEKAKQLETVLVALLTINSLYAFSWDVVMDWGMMHDPAALLVDNGCVKVPTMPGVPPPPLNEPRGCKRACLRPKLRFGVLISMTILVTNFCLRFFWLSRFWEKEIFASLDLYVLCTEFLEIFRRSIWNLLRVEWENIKISKAASSSSGSKAFPIEGDENDHPFFASSAPSAISMVPLNSPARF